MKIAFDYKAELNQLRFTPEEKASMTERLLSAAQKTGSVQKPRRRWKRSAVAAVAAVACLCVGAGAVGVTKLASDTFSPVFGSAETEIVDKIGHPIGASATAGGVTITADAIIGDKHHYAIAYTIEKNDGSAFDFDVNATVGNGVPDFHVPIWFRRGRPTFGLLYTDNDFMEDHWEAVNRSNLLNVDTYDAQGDADGDGWSNWAEARANFKSGRHSTDPNKVSSVSKSGEVIFEMPTKRPTP